MRNISGSKLLKKAVPLAMVASLCMGSMSVAAFAQSENYYSDALQETIFEELKDHILNKYGELYQFDNFSYEFLNERVEDGCALADVNIVVDMTLTQHPSQSPYIQALSTALDTSVNQNEKNALQSQIDAYTTEIMDLYYNIPDTSAFLYTVSTPIVSYYSGNSISYELFHRVDIGNDDCEYLIAPVEPDEVLESEDTLGANVAAEIAALQISTENAVSPSASITYYRLRARNYALSHATDEPEFNSSNGGSDCANFVSKSLNYGGFPTDSSNQWYPASTYGNTDTCGTNWMRTGYSNNGGVVPYMVDTKGYFAQVAASAANAGCIMYWTDTSHVALVTYGDTATVKYTQHSNKTLSSAASTNIVYDSSEVSAYFYKPTSSVTVSEIE